MFLAKLVSVEYIPRGIFVTESNVVEPRTRHVADFFNSSRIPLAYEWMFLLVTCMHDESNKYYKMSLLNRRSTFSLKKFSC